MHDYLMARGVVSSPWQAFATEMLDCASGNLHAFYQSGFSYLDGTLADKELVAVDIETTGLNAEADRIVSIGLVHFNLQRIYLQTARHWLVDPVELTDTSVVVHGITHSDVSTAPRIEEVIPELLNELSGKLVVVHYRAMEREFFRKLGFDIWEQPWLFPVMDTFALECSYVSGKRKFLERLMRKPLPSLRLPNVRQRYGLPDYENHNALIDAIATAELLQAMAQVQRLKNRPIMSVIV